MWNSIAQVTTALTLIAFIVAAAYWAYRSSLVNKERLIEKAPDSEKAALIRNVLEGVEIDTSKLKKDQIYDLAKEQLQHNIEKYRIRAKVIIYIASILCVVSIVAFVFSNNVSSNINAPNDNSMNSPRNSTNSNNNLKELNQPSNNSSKNDNSNPSLKISRIKVIFNTTNEKQEGEIIRITIKNKINNEVLAEEIGEKDLWEVGTEKVFDIKLKSPFAKSQCNELLIEIKKTITTRRWTAVMKIEGFTAEGQSIQIKADNEFVNLKGDGYFLKNGLFCP